MKECMQLNRIMNVKFPKRFIIVAGFYYKEKLKLNMFLKKYKVKLNSTYFQQNIAECIFEEKISDLYEKK